MKHRSYSVLAMCLAGVVLLGGCPRSQRPLTLDEMYEQERKLPAVFLTSKTNQRVTAPGDSGVFVDEATGELCWPALACGNPECPGRSEGGEPFLFIAPDPAVVILADGSVGYDSSQRGEIDNYYGNCPQCREIRDLGSESDEDRQKYSNFVRPHVLSETARRREELMEARQEREEELKERMQRSSG